MPGAASKEPSAKYIRRRFWARSAMRREARTLLWSVERSTASASIRRNSRRRTAKTLQFRLGHKTHRYRHQCGDDEGVHIAGVVGDHHATFRQCLQFSATLDQASPVSHPRALAPKVDDLPAPGTARQEVDAHQRQQACQSKSEPGPAGIEMTPDLAPGENHSLAPTGRARRTSWRHTGSALRSSSPRS